MTNTSVALIVGMLLLPILITLKDRSTGHSALYTLLAFIAEGIRIVAAILPALAIVMEQIPSRLIEEWKLERARDQFQPEVNN